mgnify:CR=1 FL=1
MKHTIKTKYNTKELSNQDKKTIEIASINKFDVFLSKVEDLKENMIRITNNMADQFEYYKKEYTKDIEGLKSENEKFSKMICKFVIFGVVMIAILSVFAVMHYQKEYNDLNEKYTYVSNQFSDLNNKYEYLAAEVNDLYSQLEKDDIKVEAPINTAILTEKSNLSVDQINDILSQYAASRNITDSKLLNLGESIHKMEEEYNVNAFFCMSVAIYESTTGTSDAAVNHNNIFGLVKNKKIMNFVSLDDCVQYWGNLMRYKYIDTGLTSIDAIQTKYAPKSKTWATNVTIIHGLLTKYV